MADACAVIILPVVPVPLTGISLDNYSLEMNVGDITFLSVILLPDDRPRGVDVTFFNSNNDVIILSGPFYDAHSIRLYARGVGTSKITVKAGEFSDTCIVTVVDPDATLSPVLSSTEIPPSATPRPPSSATAAVTPTPAPTRGSEESAYGGPQPTREPVALEASDWAAAEQAIAGMEPGSRGSIESPDDTLVPVSLLKTLRETQCALEIDMGGYTCVIDGHNLADISDNLQPIDIGMTAEKDAAVSATCGGSAYELRFNYHGALPGVFTFRIKAEGSRPGDTVYFYYFDDTAGEFEGVEAATVDDEGFASVRITHCSSYYLTSVIIDDAKNNFEPPAPEAAQSGFAAFVEQNAVTFWVGVYVLGCGAVIITFVVIFHRRGKKRAAVQQTHMMQ